MSQTKVSKHDVAVEKHRLDIAKVERSAEIWTTLVRGLVTTVQIAACAVPLLALQAVVEPLSGKETIVEANVVVNLTLAISVVVNVAQWAKSRSQKRELKRQRRIINDLQGKQLA